MKMNTVFIRAAIATAFVGVGASAIHVPHAAAAQEGSTMSVDARAPMHATLLPVLSIVGSAGNPEAPATSRIGNEESLSVTLMPTVYVSAQSPALAAALQQEAARVAVATDAVSALLHVEVEHRDAAHAETSPGLRAHVMPR